MAAKLKIAKNFAPCVAEDNDELFPNGIFEFNVTKMLAFIKDNLDQITLETIEVQSCHCFSKNLTESTIDTADLSTPLIFVEISPGNFNIIDGHHRLEKATRLKIKNLPAFKLSANQHINFLTSLKSYEMYVNYWNNKIKELK